ncbi:hypothetical protein [Bacillus pseudomycoides]|uniref:Uncharacterized protein n=1 Tax=Bacillus pseudomycoides TaxID=64104 RepID=A0A2B5HM41_9BACI|nr:hypothetical protein [Bacillus pseudomycoides]PEA80765.1 hypothetical protein CON99_26235 [Bacillus pseudomycoides]PED70429.1 hypothetical protein CON97_19435 [Bacillus pseudomycoides]PEF72096.1 hypothetical protein CON94_28445 [Bacillus pseudomycoides]PEI33558.1 hypothetical protein CN620_27430 [Bacillus pseudomycoides]PEJ71188.1 hypothetical protein CN680_22840 [Bacillus pseudomycoides]
MQINFEQLRSLMKKSGIPVSRDSAPTNTDYPYIVYEFVNEQHKRASNKVLKSMPLYQVAVITNGTEADYEPLKAVFNDAGVSYTQFEGMPYDENDDTITQFITYVRCIQ